MWTTDFQNGNAEVLFRSVTEKLFALTDDCLVYPCHDYNNRRVSSISQEKTRNPRLGNNRTLEEFQEVMANLKLPPPQISSIMRSQEIAGAASAPIICQTTCKTIVEHMTQSPAGLARPSICGEDN